MKELGKQVLSLFLALLTFISCISYIGIDKAQATTGQGSYNGAGNTMLKEHIMASEAELEYIS